MTSVCCSEKNFKDFSFKKNAIFKFIFILDITTCLSLFAIQIQFRKVFKTKYY